MVNGNFAISNVLEHVWKITFIDMKEILTLWRGMLKKSNPTRDIFAWLHIPRMYNFLRS